MVFWDNNKHGKQVVNDNEPNDANRITSLQLHENDLLILEKMNLLQQTIEGMNKDNKKALMMGTLNDEKIKHLENKILDMKLGVIDLLDLIDVLMTAVNSCEVEYLKQGLGSYNNKILEIAGNLDIEMLNVVPNVKFNPKEMDCKKKVCMEEYDDDVVVEIARKGYRDIGSGNILRYAVVCVNKL